LRGVLRGYSAYDEQIVHAILPASLLRGD